MHASKGFCLLPNADGHETCANFSSKAFSDSSDSFPCGLQAKQTMTMTHDESKQCLVWECKHLGERVEGTTHR
eukprot:m.206034 g.206034  ORF g.206034 m.206034 type:complete len:73 (+) comp15018_c1_seq5:1799-2017(+)